MPGSYGSGTYGAATYGALQASAPRSVSSRDTSLTIRLKALDGSWEECGVDRMPAVKPESLQLVSDSWGSLTCGFQLKRPLDGSYPDLFAYTPCRVEIDGVLVWSGEVWETPAAESDEPVIQVNGRGRPDELDDDPFERAWAHTRLEDWVDVRSRPLADLNIYKEGAAVESGNGAIVIGWATDTAVANGDRVGVTLDLHQADAKRVVLSLTAFGISGQTLRVRGHDTDDAGATASELAISVTNPGTGIQRATLTTSRRYLTIALEQTGGSGTTTVDQKIQLNAIRVFRDTAFESGDRSALKADAVFRDAMVFTSLSQDFSEIQTPSTSLPEYAPFEDRSPRDHIDAANDPLGWQPSILPDGRPRFRPWPVRPKYRATGMAKFRNASMHSGEPIYNHAVVVAQLEDGTQMKVERYAAQQPGAHLEAVASPAFPNPSFDTDASGWTLTTRDTGVYDTAPASGRISAADAAVTNISGTWKEGVFYVVVVRLRSSGAVTPAAVYLTFGTSPNDYIIPTYVDLPATTWIDVPIVFSPPADVAVSKLTLPAVVDLWVDSLKVYVAKATLLDRRNRRRTKIINVGAALNVSTMQGIADSFLRESMGTPLRGPMSVPVGAIKPYAGSEDVHPSRLLLDGGELVHLPKQTDPDSGASGRNGRIATITYDHASELAAVAIDETSDQFARVLASYGAGGG